MTREDAIEIFKDWIDEGVEYDDGYAARKLYEEEEQAVIMAIQALSQEPCTDAVSREAVIKTINNNTADERDGWLCIDNDLVHEIEKLPSVTQKSETVTEFADRCRECGARYGKLLEQKKGHWICHYDEDEKVGWYECDRCHTERAFNTKFCPDCGAKMESGDKE